MDTVLTEELDQCVPNLSQRKPGRKFPKFRQKRSEARILA